MYNRTDLDQMIGPITPQQFQQDRHGTASAGITQKFRFKPSK